MVRPGTRIGTTTLYSGGAGATILPNVASLPIVPAAGPPLVDGVLASEQVPQLFRVVLDLVVELEQRGGRRDAERMRREAIAAYSAGWDEASMRRLSRIVDALQRRLANPGIRSRLLG
jgi:hypothetical protein